MSKARELLEALGLMTQSQIDRINYDRTVIGSIVSVDDLSAKIYTVSNGGINHTARGTATYSLGDQVYVTIPADEEQPWQILSIAQEHIIGAQLINYNDIPENNLFIDNENYDSFTVRSTDEDDEDFESIVIYGNGQDHPREYVDIYHNSIIQEIKKTKKLYIQGLFEVISSQNRSEMEYSLSFEFNNGDDFSKIFSIDDMTGDPTQGSQTQIFCFEFTDNEIESLTALNSIILSAKYCEICLKNFCIYGTLDLNYNNISCYIYQGDTRCNTGVIYEKSGDDLTARLFSGTIEIPQAAAITSYQWQREQFQVFDSDSDWGLINANLNTTQSISADETIYPITKFGCIITFSGNSYDSGYIQIKDDDKSYLSVTAARTIGTQVILTPSVEDQVLKWSFKNISSDDVFISPSSSDVDITINDDFAQFTYTGPITIDANKINVFSEICCYQENNHNYSITSLSHIERNTGNIEVLNVSTYLYNLAGQRISTQPTAPLIATLYYGGTNVTDDVSSWTWEFPESSSVLIKSQEDGNQCSFELDENYDFTKTNNSIIVTATYDGYIYKKIISIGILRMGDPGTNGTDKFCKIGVKNGSSTDFPPYAWFPSGTSLTLPDNNKDNNNYFKLEFRNGEGELLSADSIEWFMYSDVDRTPGKTIIGAKINYLNQDYYAYLPVASYSGSSDPFQEGSGFAHVIYSSNGEFPQYAHNSFEFLSNISYCTYPPTLFKELSDNLEEAANGRVTQRFSSSRLELELIPKETYNLETFDPSYHFVTFGLVNGVIINIPFLFTYNTHEIAQINEWDGTSISTSSGAVLSPMAGFGDKDRNNGFSGVVLGKTSKWIDSTAGGSEEQVNKGIFGFNGGKQTFYLDASNGSAIFGSADSGQIKITPANCSIESGNYYAGDSEFGYSQKGMKIDLANGSISAPNFSLAADGDAYFKGRIEATSGKIGNMDIEDVVDRSVGVNLVREGHLNSASEYWRTAGPCEADFSQGYLKFTRAETQSSTGSGFYYQPGNNSLPTDSDFDKYYTLSFEIKAGGSVPDDIAEGANKIWLLLYHYKTTSADIQSSAICEYSIDPDDLSTNKWKRIVVPGLNTRPTNFSSYNRTEVEIALRQDMSICVRNIMVEQGSRASAIWSPSAEDSVVSNVNTNDFSWLFSPSDGLFMWNGEQETISSNNPTGGAVFSITTEGLHMKGKGLFEGEIIAASGNIAGWNIKSKSLTSDKFFNSSKENNRIGFFVDYDPKSDFGNEYAKYSTISIGNSDQISNWRVIIGKHFGITADGTIYNSSCSMGPLVVKDKMIYLGTEESYGWKINSLGQLEGPHMNLGFTNEWVTLTGTKIIYSIQQNSQPGQPIENIEVDWKTVLGIK